MKTLRNLLLAGAFAFSSNVFSQYCDNPALVELDAKRRSIELKSEDVKSNYSFVGELPLDGELRNKCENRVLSSYFRNDEFALNQNDSLDMERYLKVLEENASVHYFQVRGYADINGESNHNYNLALNRATQVSSLIREKYPEIPIELISVGESGTTDNLAENRKVEVVLNEPSFYTELQKSDAKYFLLDLSGSMKDFVMGTRVPKYAFLREVEFPNDARLFGFFSGEIPKGDGLLNLDSFQPKGCSEVYGSSKDLIDVVMNPGEELHLFTDGISTDEEFSAQDVIDAAKKKNVKVSVVGVGMPDYAIFDFMRIASETGGDYSVGNL